MRAGTLIASVALLWAATSGCNAIPINIPDPSAVDGGSPDLDNQGLRDTGLNQDAPIGLIPDMASPPPPIRDLEHGTDGGPSAWDSASYPDGSACFGDALCPPPSDGGTEAGPTEAGPGEAGPNEAGPNEAGTELEAGQPLDAPLPLDAEADL